MLKRFAAKYASVGLFAFAFFLVVTNKTLIGEPKNTPVLK